MPQIAFSLIAAYAFESIAAAGIFGLAAGSLGATLVAGLIASAIMAFGTMLMMPSQKGPPTTVRQAIVSHKLRMGYGRQAGSITFAQNPAIGGGLFGAIATGILGQTDNNEQLILVATWLDRPVFSIDTKFFDDTEIPTDASGLSVVPQPLPDGSKPRNFRGHVQFVDAPGTVARDAAFHAFMSDKGATAWTGDCRQDGRAKTAIWLLWNATMFATGIPNMTAIIRGRMVYDTRDSGIAITTSDSGDPGLIHTGAPHGRAPGDLIWIRDHDAIDSDGDDVDQEYEIGTTPSSTSLTLLKFSVDLEISTPGTGGRLIAMKWTDNSLLCANDYLMDPIYGYEARFSDEIPEAIVSDGANVCDEMVARSTLTSTFTADPVTNLIEYSPSGGAGDLITVTELLLTNSGGALPSPLAANTIYYFVRYQETPMGYLCTTLHNAQQHPPDFINITDAGTGIHSLTLAATFTAALQDDSSGDSLLMFPNHLRINTGTKVRLATTGTLPSPFAPATDYFAVCFTDRRIKLATSLANARAGTLLVPTDAGSGVHTITAIAEPRYTCNGEIDTNDQPLNIIEQLCSSMAGYLVPSGAIMTLYPGAYRAPVITIDEGDFRSALELTALTSGQQSFNSTRGTYIDPANGWQRTDFPSRKYPAFIAEDNGRVVWRDMAFPFTISPSTSQRLAKIAVQRVRREQQVKLPLMLTAFQLSAADNFYLDYARWGWSQKVFELHQTTFSVRPDSNNVPTLNVDLLARENDADVYAWDAADELASKKASPTGLPQAFEVAAPSVLTVTSGDGVLYIRSDGVVFARTHLRWTQPADTYVLDGGFIEVAYKRSDSNIWLPGPALPGSLTEAYISDVQDSVAYDFAVRSRNAIGAVSDDEHPWQAELLGVLIEGKNLPPANITTLTVRQVGAVLILAGSPIADDDCAAFEYRYGVSQNWDTGILIEAPHARPSGDEFAAICTTANVPIGQWWFMVKAIDTSGNYSQAAAFTLFNVVDSAKVLVLQQTESPDWLNFGVGSGTGFVIDAFYDLVPDSTDAAVIMTDHDLFENFVKFPVASSIYEAAEIDLGADEGITLVRQLVFAAGRGIVGSPDCIAEYDSRTAAGSYSGVWTEFDQVDVTARYVKVRARMTAGAIPGYVSFFSVLIYTIATATQSGTATAAAGGTAVVFDTAFHATPNLAFAAQGANVAWATSLSSTGFTLHVGPNTGSDTGGTASWIATGQ